MKTRGQLPHLFYPEPTMQRRQINSYAFGSAFDADAVAYFAAITTAGSSISSTNQAAVNAFIVGCKLDGIWSAIKASCILAGADDLTGALVPLVGSAPAIVNFVSGDYSRTAGLIGNGTNKYLRTSRNNQDDPQNSHHLAVFRTVLGSGSGLRHLLNYGGGISGSSNINLNGTALETRSRSFSTASLTAGGDTTGFIGISRASSANYIRRAKGSNTTITNSSQTPASGEIYAFARNAVAQYSDERMSFYSIGESLDLALLDARLSTLMASLV